jgi:transposase
MARPIDVAETHTSAELRSLARRSKNGPQSCRLLSIAALLDGASRSEAAAAGGMDRQTLRDWVHRFNQDGPDGLINHKAPGPTPKLTEKQKADLATLVDQGPIPAIHGVVRWRASDLMQWIYDEFGISISDSTVYRLLDDLGFSHVSARPKAYKQNEEALAAFKKTSPRKSRKSATRSAPERRSKSGSRTR